MHGPTELTCNNEHYKVHELQLMLTTSVKYFITLTTQVLIRPEAAPTRTKKRGAQQLRTRGSARGRMYIGPLADILFSGRS